MVKANMNSINEFLEKQEMDCHLIPQNEEIPSDILFVTMGVDEKGRDLLMQISLAEEDFSESFELFDLEKSSPKRYVIHVFMALPFMVKDQFVGDISRLILLLNKTMRLPGFGFSEVDRMIFFSNKLMITEELDELMLMSLVGNVITYVDAFEEPLEVVADGRMSFSDIIKSLSE